MQNICFIFVFFFSKFVFLIVERRNRIIAFYEYMYCIYILCRFEMYTQTHIKHLIPRKPVGTINFVFLFKILVYIFEVYKNFICDFNFNFWACVNLISEYKISINYDILKIIVTVSHIYTQQAIF